jgi:hypothetical protein
MTPQGDLDCLMVAMRKSQACESASVIQSGPDEPPHGVEDRWLPHRSDLGRPEAEFSCDSRLGGFSMQIPDFSPDQLVDIIRSSVGPLARAHGERSRAAQSMRPGRDHCTGTAARSEAPDNLRSRFVLVEHRTLGRHVW